MKRLFVLTVALLASASVYAQSDAIKQRQEAMKSAGGATATVGKMLKGEDAFDLAKAKAALQTYIDIAAKAPTLFPEGSQNGDTAALPTVWSAKTDFDAKFAKWGAESKAALEVIKDEASFKATFPGVMKNCGGCHETYRAKKG
jgi:cytochrome c556